MRRLGAAKVHDANPRAGRQPARRLGGTQRILDLAQMPDHRHVEAAGRPAGERRRCSRLVQHANLSSKLRRQAPSREVLQRNQPIGRGERAQNRRRIAIDIFVDVGAGQSHDQRPFRVKLAKAPDAVGAAPGMQRNHQIRCCSNVAAGGMNLVAELAQNPRPSCRRGPIAGP